jgi:DNA-binding MarR family transcriptional regulator
VPPTTMRGSGPDTASLISQAHLLVSRRVSDAVTAAGFRARPSYGAVFALLGPHGSRLSDLARVAQVSPQAMGELVDELEQLGYVVRTPDPADRRAKLITLTALGRRCDAAAGEAIAALERDITAALGERAHQQLRRSLTRLLGPDAGEPRPPMTTSTASLR